MNMHACTDSPAPPPSATLNECGRIQVEISTNGSGGGIREREEDGAITEMQRKEEGEEEEDLHTRREWRQI